MILVGNPGCPRVAGFQAALARCGQPHAHLLPWLDLIAGADLPAGLVRLESPGRDWEVEKALIAEGADHHDSIDRAAALSLEFDKGRIWHPRQWFLGFCAVLRRLPLIKTTNPPADVELLFDKPRCQSLFAEAGLPVPRSLGQVRSHDELREAMLRHSCRAAFVKLAHGSSASGVVAYRDGEAVTTVEMVRQGGLKLYNSRLIRTYRRPADLVTLIDALAQETVQAEEWLPKAELDGQGFDLRILVIAGRARHAVVRMSRTPFTNLHLGNQRGDLAAVIERMGDAWPAALQTCERAAALFPGSLHLGVDLLIHPDWRTHSILEANAFGDLLPGVLHEGMDTWEAEIRARL